MAHPQTKVKTSFLGISGSAETMGTSFVREKDAMMPNSTPNCHQLANRLFRWEKMDPVTMSAPRRCGWCRWVARVGPGKTFVSC